jgi:hypothetical protein
VAATRRATCHRQGSCGHGSTLPPRPSARARSRLLAAIPPGTLPGVDDTEVHQFLDRHGDDASD